MLVQCNNRFKSEYNIINSEGVKTTVLLGYGISEIPKGFDFPQSEVEVYSQSLSVVIPEGNCIGLMDYYTDAQSSQDTEE